MECIMLNKEDQNPFIKNLGGTKNCYISELQAICTLSTATSNEFSFSTRNKSLLKPEIHQQLLFKPDIKS